MEKKENKYLEQYREKVKGYEKFSKKNYLMANVLFECIDRKKNFYEIISEITAYVKTISGDEWSVDLNPELIIEYFALSLGCSGKEFFKKPEETIGKFFKYYSPTYSNYDIERDNRNKIVSISIPMEIYSLDYVDDSDSSIIKYLDEGKWRYAILVSPPDRIIDETEDTEGYYVEKGVSWWLQHLDYSTRNLIRINDMDELIKNEFESLFDWKECLLRQSYDDDRFELWVNKLRKETLDNRIDWIKLEKEEDCRWYRCTLGEQEVHIRCFHLIERTGGRILTRPDQLALYLSEDNIVCFQDEEKISCVEDDNMWEISIAKNYIPNEKIRALVQIIENYLLSRGNETLNSSLPVKELKFGDILIHSGSMYCKIKNHSIIPYRGLVPILTDDNRKELYEIYVGYCVECKTYIAFRSDYMKMLDVGHPLCRVFAYEDERKEYKTEFSKYKSQSVLAALGYNVQEKTELSQDQRKEILKRALDANIVEVHDVVDFLNWLVMLHEPQSKKYGKAIEKWKEDISFVEEYKKEERETIVVDKIRIRK